MLSITHDIQNGGVCVCVCMCMYVCMWSKWSMSVELNIVGVYVVSIFVSIHFK